MPPPTVVVLAGRRPGTVDPLAAAAGIADKCLVPVAGRPMIAHVLDTLSATDGVARIVVSANERDILETLPVARRLAAEGRLTVVASRDNLADSVVAALADAQFPALVTTADNVLLTAEAIVAINRAALAEQADVAVAFAPRDAVLAAHPDGQRRFYRFGEDAYSNCNAYWIGNAQALAVAEVFRSGGQFAKHPLRIVAALGVVNLVRFRFGLGSLAGAFRGFSRRFRLVIRPVVLTDGAVAIDVDNARTLRVVEDILARRSRLAA